MGGWGWREGLISGECIAELYSFSSEVERGTGESEQKRWVVVDGLVVFPSTYT